MNSFWFWYFFGILICSNIQIIWMFTNMPIYIFKFLNIKNIKSSSVYTREEFEDWLLINLGNLGELLSCPLCMSTHTSWIISLILYFLFKPSVYLLFLPVLTWPFIVFLIYSFLKKINH